MAEPPRIPTLALNDGAMIPQIGFGVYLIEPADTLAAVTQALRAGYRHVDTAATYGNEIEVGEAVREFDENVFITTKYFNPDIDHGYVDAKLAFDRSFQRLGLSSIDLYLIHWPVFERERYVETWEALVELRDTDRVRSIGVSNFSLDHLEKIDARTGITPAVNQIELHPYFQQTELRREHAARGIVTEAWGPLGQGTVLDDQVLIEIGEAHEKSPAQVVLRWHLQLGNVVIPKSSNPARIKANLAIFDFSLADDEMASIRALDRGERVGPDPSTFSFPREFRGRAAEAAAERAKRGGQ